jgi:hypothetical protein
MTNKELIKQLKKLPKNAIVNALWDGEPRTEINAVWLANNGEIILCDNDDLVYSDMSRPKSAPKAADDPFWKYSKMEVEE